MRQRGFTLIELLIVIGIIAILAAVVLIAINPGRQFDQANDSRRRTDILAIINSIDQYRAENAGTRPPSITTTSTEICLTGAASCTGLIDLSADVVPTYINSLPADPECPTGCATNGNGYFVVANTDGTTTVNAPLAALSSISVTR